MHSTNTELPGGSHNRQTTQSYDFAMSGRGKFKICKCPLHYNLGNGTEIELVYFRRQGDTNSQGMCAEGKTLIDSFSHQLNRLQLLFTAKPELIDSFFERYPTKFKPILSKICTICSEILNTVYDTDNIRNKLTQLTNIDKKLRTKATGFYESRLKAADKLILNKLLTTCISAELKNEVEAIQLAWVKDCFIIDSVDGKLYPFEEFGFNFSKKRELYDSNKRLTPYRVNVHNTRAKGQRSSTRRAEKYLADGMYTEANRYMKKIGESNKNIHADHIVPLALGGIHDTKNLQKLAGKENIYKKDKLTRQGLELIKKDISYLSKWHHKTFERHKNDAITLIEQALRKSVFDFRESIINLSVKKKYSFIKKTYPTYKAVQIEKIILKFFTND